MIIIQFASFFHLNSPCVLSAGYFLLMMLAYADAFYNFTIQLSHNKTKMGGY